MWQLITFRRRPSSKRIANRSRGRRLLAERLENREVLSATFGSALSIYPPKHRPRCCQLLSVASPNGT